LNPRDPGGKPRCPCPVGFEDLICWQKARELTREIYKSLNDEKFKRLSRLSEDCSVLIWRLIQRTKQQLKAAKFQK